MQFPERVSIVAFVGDTHGDTDAIAGALHEAALLGAGCVVSVGDLWWRPNSQEHAGLVQCIDEATRACGVPLLLIDGNNDDAAALQGQSDFSSPLPLLDMMFYAPRGSSWVWGARRFAALGGAISYKAKTAGVDWFPGERLQQTDIERAVALGHVDVLVSHDAPAGVALPLKLTPGPDAEHREAVRCVLDAVSPSVVIHGHYHRSYESQLDGVRVYGLGRDVDGTADVCVFDLADLSLTARFRTS